MQIFNFVEKTTTIKCDGCLEVIRVYDQIIEKETPEERDFCKKCWFPGGM